MAVESSKEDGLRYCWLLLSLNVRFSRSEKVLSKLFEGRWAAGGVGLLAPQLGRS